MRKSWAVAIGAIAVAGAVLTPTAAWAAPAAAGLTAGTITTFGVSSGTLTLSAPATAGLGAGAPGTNVHASLGTVKVSDNRASLTASWTATVSTTDFTTGTATAAETIPATDISYTVGTITPTGTITAEGTDVTMSNSDQTVVDGSDGVGDNAAAWDPTVAVAVPASAVGGSYTGTITHSVD